MQRNALYRGSYRLSRGYCNSRLAILDPGQRSRSKHILCSCLSGHQFQTKVLIETLERMCNRLVVYPDRHRFHQDDLVGICPPTFSMEDDEYGFEIAFAVIVMVLVGLIWLQRRDQA